MVCARDQRVVCGLSKHEYVAAIQTVAGLLPGLSCIARNKDAAKLLIVKTSSVKDSVVTLVHQQSRRLSMGKSAVRSCERHAAIVAGEHSAAVSCQQHARGLPGINQHIINDDVGTRHVFPCRSRVSSLPQT